MTIHFGYYTFGGIAVGALVPFFLAFLIWCWQMFQLERYLRHSQGASLSRPVFETMMQGQYYPFWVLQPLHWAMPYMLMLSMITMPAGILLDNGVYLSYFTAAATIIGGVTYAFLVIRFDSDETHSPWWSNDFAAVIFISLFALLGGFLDNMP